MLRLVSTLQRVPPDTLKGGHRTVDFLLAASLALRNADIPGIKYLDQGSRIDPAQIQRQIAETREQIQRTTKLRKTLTKQDDLKSADDGIARLKNEIARLEQTLREPGTYNYVIFDDRLVTVTAK